MNNTGKISALLAVMRKQTNGEVSSAMSERGVVWPLNYGVSVPSIRDAAAAYAPDHDLGKLLYRQDVRELRLAGIMIADSARVTENELPFWGAGIVNTEVAEHISFLMAGSNIVSILPDKWINPDSELQTYAAVLSVVRKTISSRSADWLNTERLLSKIMSVSSVQSCFVWRSVASLINSLFRFSPESRPYIAQTIETLENVMTPPAADCLKEELFLYSD